MTTSPQHGAIVERPHRTEFAQTRAPQTRRHALRGFPWLAWFVAALLILIHAPASRGEVRRGTIQILSLSAPSLGGESRTVRVYLPTSYFDSEAASRRYPVVYLLHGWPGSDGNLFQLGKAAESADELIAAGLMPEVILICPNGAGDGLLGRSMWIDGRAGTRPIEDFVVKDLVRWADARFRTVPTARCRGLIGISDGGTAAVNLALRHRDVFGACGAHSADFQIERGLSTRRLLGGEPEASHLVAQNSPVLYLAQHIDPARGLVIYFDCGTSDETLRGSRRLDLELSRAGVAHTYREFPGSHTWGYWRAHLRDSLVAVTERMRSEDRGA
jgi:S-formylglutathione hydrolase FrmB